MRIDLRHFSGNVTERIIAHLRSHDPSFETLPWAQQVTRAGMFRQQNSHRIVMSDADAASAPPSGAAPASTESKTPHGVDVGAIAAGIVEYLEKKVDGFGSLPQAQKLAKAREITGEALSIMDTLLAHSSGGAPAEGAPVAAGGRVDLRGYTGNVTQRCLAYLGKHDPGFRKLPWEQQVTRAGMFRTSNEVLL
jgi:hypothetical protein